MLVDLEISNKIQHEEYSTGSAADGTPHKTTGQLWYLILNRNADKRNLNVNRYNLDNNWNENYRFLVVRNYLQNPRNPSYSRGVSGLNCFLQPPSILPASAIGMLIAAYFLLSSWQVPQISDTLSLRYTGYKEPEHMPRGIPATSPEVRTEILTKIKEHGERVPDLAKQYGLATKTI